MNDQHNLPPVTPEQPGHVVDAPDVPRRFRRLSGRQRMLGWLIALLVIAGLVWLGVHLAASARENGGQGGPGGRPGGARAGGGGRGPGGGGRGAATVGVAKATVEDIPVILESLGTVTPAATVTVRPQVGGAITRIAYREGQLVRKGQLLAVIDSRPYQASLQQAQGALARDRATLENARLVLRRYQTLLSQDSIARQDVDTQAALVRQLEGTAGVNRGSLEAARVNVGFTRIVSPVTGRVGLRPVDVGNYVGAGDANGVAVVTTVAPIDVQFTIPQDQAGTIQRRLLQGAELPVVALDRTRTTELDHGRFGTLDNQVNGDTGTIAAKARFPNAGSTLFPSAFVNVRVTVDTVRNAVTVPNTAVRTGATGTFVWLRRADGTVTQRPVRTGATIADRVQIISGVARGDTVVTEGGDRLTEGAQAQVAGQRRPGQGQGQGQGGGQGRGRRGQAG